jgi:predicted DNA repair protein MutK
MILFFLLAVGYCSATRNPFAFVTAPQVSTRSIIGRGLIHDKHMVCEAYTAFDGSIKMRWIPQNIVVKKSPST